MAFLTRLDGSLVLQQWAGIVGDVTSIAGEPANQARKVPTQFKDITNTLEVKRFPKNHILDNTRPYYIIFKQPQASTPTAPEMYTFKIHGFVVEFEVGPLGNWNGPPSLPDDANTRLYFQRRVFTKVRGGETIPNAQDLEFSDPAYGDVRPQWKIHPADHADALHIFTRKDGGQLERSSFASLQEGDFVEVTTTLEIALQRDQKQYKIHLRPQRLVLLKNAEVPDSESEDEASNEEAFVAPVLPGAQQITKGTDGASAMEGVTGAAS
ncbi:hypothetical protein FRC04_001560 [Tulasnella sp. 424]|nr:hypothetical protein FRC04_001560 [Tulasnella sp. 424]